MDHREAKFLASQAERLACNQKQRHNNNNKIDDGDNDASETVNGDSENREMQSKRATQFFVNFRKICSEFQNELDSLLLLTSSSDNFDDSGSTTTTSATSNLENIKSYYATAFKRREGGLKLDIIQKNVRLLQKHVLSSTSSSSPSSRNDYIKHEGNDSLLQSVLQTPMGEVTQTDTRLLSQEIEKIMKRIDEARELVCPKEKFIFKRYREAMEERATASTARSEETLENSKSMDKSLIRDESELRAMDKETEIESDSQRSIDNGGLLENLSYCAVEISPNNTIRIIETMETDRLQYYTSPRSVHALHLPSSSHCTNSNASSEESSLSSYLLQNLDNVIVLLHGSRPSLHLQHIHNCKIYISEPTLGAVHVTDARSSTLHCSCYQLRVHDSECVQFNVWTRSGPIIEGCKGMVFIGNYYLQNDIVDDNPDGNEKSNKITIGRNMFWDVKDFNWLRATRKSPNFVVVDGGAAGKEENTVLDTNIVIPVEKCAEMSTTMEEPDDDTEDEL